MDNMNTSNSKVINPASPVSKPGISHAPLNLGGGSSEAVSITPLPVASPPKQTAIKTAESSVSAERIRGMKTFYAKLHPGALAYLEEQIGTWLKDNPNNIIKRTDVTVGDVQGKTTEPNIVVVIWYA
jgi:hypothetical protein